MADDDTDRDALLLRALAERADPVAARWWCSFADLDGFRGVIIVDAAGPVTAVRRCHELGINPGGSVVVVPVRLDVPDEWCDRLLTEVECRELCASPHVLLYDEDDGP